MIKHQATKQEVSPSKVHGFFLAIRNPEALELMCKNRNASQLAYVIAMRANWRGDYNRHNLKFGEAFLGDHQNYGMTESEYRAAKRDLVRGGFASFKTTNRGTIARLMDERLFRINPPKNSGQPAAKSRTSDGQHATNLNLRAIKQDNDKAFSTKQPSKLSNSEKELADRIEAALGEQWVNDAGKWVNRIKSMFSKVERVTAELGNAIKENRIKTTPAQYAEQIWKEFK